MSFILDALRKSEHERHRQSGPTLAETAVAAPRKGKNSWATAVIALLLVNLFAFGFLLLHMAGERKGQTEATAAAGAAPNAGDDAPREAATRPRPESAASPMMRPARPAIETGRNPLEDEVSTPQPRIDPTLEQRAAVPPAGPPVVTSAGRGGGTVTYETLPEADPVTAANRPAPVRNATNLPSAEEILAPGGVPELRLELHVYSNDPAQRFVFINARKYREGETLAEGPRVEEITSDGVILSLRGNRFLLSRD